MSAPPPHSCRPPVAVIATLVACAGVAAACAPRPAANDPLRAPDAAELTRSAPDSFSVRFETTRGAFTVIARRAWAPRGVDRFYYLAKHRYYDSTYFFRVIENFVAQFGIAADPSVYDSWRTRRLADDSVRHSNTRGTLAFASEGPNSRTVQLFINLKDNPKLDSLGSGFPPIADVSENMRVVDALYSGYGEGGPRGLGPRQERIASDGNRYLARYFPQLDRITGTSITAEWR